MKDSQNYRIQAFNGELPYHLLLLADETQEAIDKYIHECELFTLERDQDTIGIVAIQQLSAESIEIKNIAIKPAFQKLGLGRKLIYWVKSHYHKKGIREIWVGTGDCSIYQLFFYQKCGFEMDSLKKYFFIENYTDPIFENGIQLKHMVMLKLNISENFNDSPAKTNKP